MQGLASTKIVKCLKLVRALLLHAAGVKQPAYCERQELNETAEIIRQF